MFPFNFFILILATAITCAMELEEPFIPMQIKGQLTKLLQAELTNKPEDLSKRSDHKLKQIIEICNIALQNKNEQLYFIQTLKINNDHLAKALKNIIQRAQKELDESVKVVAQEQEKPKEIKPEIVPQPIPLSKAPHISLWQAADQGDLASVDWYLNHGANVNSKSPGEESALSLAANNGHKEIVTRLIKAGADLDSRNINGHTALMFALNQKHLSIFKELINAGADMNIKDRQGVYRIDGSSTLWI